jgi:integrase
VASIIEVKGKWRAQVRRRGVQSYTRTFTTKAAAERWARQLEADIDRQRDGSMPAGPVAGAASGRVVLVADLIQAYRDLRDQARPISDASTEHYTLKHLAHHLGARDALRLTAQDLVGYCSARRDDGAGPYTCNMDIGKLGTVLRYAALAKKVALPDVVGQARPLLSHLGLIGGGGKRERRPTEDELQRLVAHLHAQHGPVYADVVRFAVLTAMRRGEIVRLRWADVDATKRLVLVRDRKHPRRKLGNDEWIPLLGDAWPLLQRQPRGDGELIFPLHKQTLSKYFRWACQALAIPDLHFHDLRHDGTSRLFEAGYQVQQVALVTGHKDWRHLRRYTNLRPEDLHRDEDPGELKSP